MSLDLYKKGLIVANQEQRLVLLQELANAYEKAGDWSTAVAYWSWFVCESPGDWTPHFNIANVLFKAQLFPQALSAIDKALPLNATPVARQLKGDILVKLNQFEAAIALFESLLDQLPKHAILNRIGVACIEIRNYQKAEKCLRQAIILKPDYIHANYHLANALSEQGKFGEAIMLYQKVLQLNPGLADAHLNLGLCYLSLEQWQEGFKLYEYRWQVEKYRKDLLATRLRALQSITEPNNKVLLWSEQGIGDEIMYLSLLKSFRQHCEKTVVMVNDRLIPLFSRSFPDIKFIPRRTSLSPGDELECNRQCPLGRLPGLLTNNFPKPATAYLKADPQAVKKFKERYGQQFRIGIAWEGGSGKQKLERSIPLELWQDLLRIKDVTWISLQYGDDRTRMIDRMNQNPGIHLIRDDAVDSLKNLDLFAAQVSAMDLVISIDNSTVHMAGALGVPVWVLLPDVPEWRWPRGGKRCVWYESVELFHKNKQPWPELLKKVLKKVSEQLTQKLVR